MLVLHAMTVTVLSIVIPILIEDRIAAGMTNFAFVLLAILTFDHITKRPLE